MDAKKKKNYAACVGYHFSMLTLTPSPHFLFLLIVL